MKRSHSQKIHQKMKCACGSLMVFSYRRVRPAAVFCNILSRSLPTRITWSPCQFYHGGLHCRLGEGKSDEVGRQRITSISVDRSGLPPDRLSNSHIESSIARDRVSTAARAKEEMTPLGEELSSLIMLKGPLTVHDFMAQCSNHLLHGYYQQPGDVVIGERGDFVTAPEVSQLFGEMIGVWCISTWETMGRPAHVRLVELGPGRGTLMRDVISVAAKFPQFASALDGVHFVELSHSLRLQQYKAIGGDLDALNKSSRIATHESANAAPEQESLLLKDGTVHKLSANAHEFSFQWHSFMYQIPDDVPVLIIGQEFLDAFPVHQFAYTDKGWREKLVDIDDSDEEPLNFRMVLSPSATPALKSLLPSSSSAISNDSGSSSVPITDSSLHRHTAASAASGANLQVGDGIEMSPLAIATCEDIARRVTHRGTDSSSDGVRGAALLIDYGEDFTQSDSLRGFSKHQQVSPLSKPGLVDLTCDVDFSMCRRAAEGKGAYATEVETQGSFLMRMGIVQRVEALLALDSTSDTEAQQLVDSVRFLVDPQQMGSRFKCVALSHPDLAGRIPGFG